MSETHLLLVVLQRPLEAEAHVQAIAEVDQNELEVGRFAREVGREVAQSETHAIEVLVFVEVQVPAEGRPFVQVGHV